MTASYLGDSDKKLNQNKQLAAFFFFFEGVVF